MKGPTNCVPYHPYPVVIECALIVITLLLARFELYFLNNWRNPQAHEYPLGLKKGA